MLTGQFASGSSGMIHVRRPCGVMMNMRSEWMLILSVVPSRPDAVRAPDLLDRVQWPGHEVEVLHAFQTMNIDEVIYVGQVSWYGSAATATMSSLAPVKGRFAPDAIGPPGVDSRSSTRVEECEQCVMSGVLVQ